MNKEEGRFGFLRVLRGRWAIVALALAGVILLLLGGKGESVGGESEEADYMTAAEEYRQRLEGDLSALCSRISGAGEIVAVMVTLDCGDRYVWAENLGSGGSSDVVISNKEGLLVERQMPQVRGVSVVCVGGGDVGVKKELTDAISAALGIPSSRIHISEGR